MGDILYHLCRCNDSLVSLLIDHFNSIGESIVYYSSVTEYGNSSYSELSQEAADQGADYLDRQNCTDCSHCINCINCINCIECRNCRNCTDCINCTDCRNCRNCINCTDQPIQIMGGIYIVTIRKDKTIKIGCKDFPISTWEDDSPNGISFWLSTSELELWNKSKHVILALAHLTS